MFLSLNSTSWSWRRRSFLYSSATVSKVSTTGRLELGLHRGERQRVLEIVLVVLLGGDPGALGLDLVDLLAVDGRPSAAALAAGAGGGGCGGRRCPPTGAPGAPSAGGGRGLGVGAGIGGLEVDDVAEQNLPGAAARRAR